MIRSLKYLCATLALALAACAHYPDAGNGDDGGGSDAGSGMTDGGNGGGSDGGSGGMTDGGNGGNSDGGSGGMTDGGTCGTCPDGTTCVDGACVCDGDGDDGSDGSCRPGKTLLCHYPPGNTGNRHDICVGDAAVPAHLAHGDTLGTCP